MKHDVMRQQRAEDWKQHNNLITDTINRRTN